MTDNSVPTRRVGAIIGALIAVALAVFLVTGGEHVGKKRSTAMPIFRQSQPEPAKPSDAHTAGLPVAGHARSRQSFCTRSELWVVRRTRAAVASPNH